MKKHVSIRLLLALFVCMAIALTGCYYQVPYDAGSTDEATKELPAEEVVQSETDTQTQENEAEDVVEEPESVPEKDIVILFTSDMHCGIDQGFGMVGLEQIKEYLISQDNAVMLVDNGDAVQGEPVGTMTRGEAIIDLMNKAGYDIAIAGNHEFDYGMDRFFELVEKAEFPYISCNFYHEGEPVFDPYLIKEIAGRKIGFVGVNTPKTITTSTPAYFKNDDGEFIYGFLQDETGEGVYNAVQDAVDAARADGAEYVIVMGHMGNEADCSPWTYADVISNTSGIDVFLDGHSHDTDQVTMTDKDGNEVLRSACGTKLDCVGYCKITMDGELSTGLYTWNNKVDAPTLFALENDMSEAVEASKAELDEKLNEVVAHTDVDLTIYDPVETDENGKPVRMIRRAETNLGDLCADAYRDQSGADIAFVNGGGIRVSLEKGDITLGNILSVHPFGNSLCVIEATGQQILDALEWSASKEPDEFGGFLQVSGLTLEINTSIPSPCVADQDGLFEGVDGERRVQNVLVDGEPIDPEKIYTVASHDYMLLNNGDGHTAFDGAELVQDCVKLDNQVLIDYITQSLDGVVGEEYADPYGQGRIVIIE
ncbi:MAG: bifunctional metallophosphatase/5'-nucleotidase [Lachnospiraceae bacterium]|nr:bifunctional metallophosphatase/5'-nucleotidase [Lachnospiraceae bacterium]